MCLENYGWSPFFAESFKEYQARGFAAGRVTAVFRGSRLIQTEAGELRVSTFRCPEMPAVGGWVAWRTTEFDASVVEAVLPRLSVLRRKAAGSRTETQVVAANVDVVFLVMGLDGDFNPRRMERLLTMTYDSGATPVVVLNEADLTAEAEVRRQAIEELAPGSDVLLVRAPSGAGIDEIVRLLRKGRSFVLIGSS